MKGKSLLKARERLIPELHLLPRKTSSKDRENPFRLVTDTESEAIAGIEAFSFFLFL